MSNRIKNSCYDGWEHFNESTDKWVCGKKIFDKYNRLSGSRYIRAKDMTKNKRRLVWQKA